MRRGLFLGALTGALVLSMAGPAGAHGWSLYLKPSSVRQGGTIRIWSTARRACPLTIRIAGHSYHYRLDRGGNRFSLDGSTPVGRDRVTVHCKGLVASETFRVVKRSGPTTPTGAGPTTPSSGGPPPAAPVPQTTPLTVSNVCHLDPGLGTQHVLDPVINGQIWPTVAWLDSSGQLAFLAASTNGDGPVDIAVIPTAANRSVVAYFARCSWPNWVSVAQWQQAQSGITAAQAGSLAYLQEVMPINDSLDSLALPWVTPQVGWSECPTNPYADCDYQPVGPDGEPLSDVG
jgi:hypothetical protein